MLQAEASNTDTTPTQPHQVGLLFFNYHNDARYNKHKIEYTVVSFPILPSSSLHTCAENIRLVKLQLRNLRHTTFFLKKKAKIDIIFFKRAPKFLCRNESSVR